MKNIIDEIGYRRKRDNDKHLNRYTISGANEVLMIFKNRFDEEAHFCGSYARGVESTHDIDIVLPNCCPSRRLKQELRIFFDATEVIDTDWGGYFLVTPVRGNIDVFFNTKGHSRIMKFLRKYFWVK